MVKSLISAALGKQEIEKGQAPPQNNAVKEVINPADEELAKIAEQLKVKIKIFGCGGGGSNTINRCVEEGITGAEMYALNTDAKHLLTIKVSNKILIGKRLTRGLGAGAKPEIGEEAAKENEEDIKRAVENADIVFVTAGMGGGTGTGSAHYVAKMAKSAGALVMGVVTIPFSAEGSVRKEQAMAGIEKLRKVCDTTIVISNDKLLELVPKMPLDAAFKVADEVLMTAIKGITEIVTKPGLVNIDYADLQTVMKDGGVAMIGLGESDSVTDRVTEAVNEALTSPLLGLNDADFRNAQGALVRVVGGPNMTVTEAQKAAEIVGSKINKRARMIWGCTVDPTMESGIKVMLIITGVNSASLIGQSPASAKLFETKIKKSLDNDDVGIDNID